MTQQIIDNLHKYGLEFQSKIIAGIISDQSFFERILDIIDIEFFENEAHKWILKEAISYFLEYKSAPTLQVYKVRIDTIKSDLLKQTVIDNLRSVYTKLTDSDLNFVREQFLEFCKNQKLKSAIYNSVDLLKSGDYEKVKHLVDEAIKAGAERNLGHNYHKEVDIRMSEAARKTVTTGWDVIDSLMDGGLGPGELGVMVAPSGVGKSWLLAAIGSSAMKRGLNTMHYTLELNENYVGLRYDCCFTGINFQDIKKNVDVVKKKLSTVDGKLFVKYFPLKTVSAQGLKMHFERLMMLEGIKPDLIVVDYADLIRPIEKEKNSNSYSEAGNVYEELRMIAGELGVPVWTASQTNRGGATEHVVEAHNIADSYRKIMTADFVMSISRNKDDKVNNVARAHVIKNRFGPDGITLYSKMNANNGQIGIYDADTKESSHIKSIMDAGEENSQNHIKKQLVSKWRGYRGEQQGNDVDL
jgi:replicative DNA helicase